MEKSVFLRVGKCNRASNENRRLLLYCTVGPGGLIVSQLCDKQKGETLEGKNMIRVALI